MAFLVVLLAGTVTGAQDADPPAEPPSAETPSDEAAAPPEGDVEPEPEPEPEEEDDTADTDISVKEERVASENDVLQRLEEGSQTRVALWENGPISVLFPYWQELNTRLDDTLSLRLGASYYMLWQFSTSSADPPRAGAGDFDFYGRWVAFRNDAGARGQLGFNIEDRHRYMELPPSDLDQPLGSIWNTSRGFSDSGFAMNELWWNQRSARDVMNVRVGTVNQKHFYDLHRFKSQKRFFTSAPLSDSPTIAFPRTGLGARVRFSPSSDLHFTLGMGDANGDRSILGIDTFFRKAEYFAAFDMAITPKYGERTGRYSLTLWHVDARQDDGVPSGRGLSFLAEQEVVKGIVPFVRYGWGDGANLRVEQFAAVGLGLETPFGQDDDVAGFAGSWSRPADRTLRDQWGFETFYRFQLTDVLQVTPGAQIIVDPSLNPSEDVIGIVQVRVGFVF